MKTEYWSGLPPFPSPGDLPHQGIEPTPLACAYTSRQVLYDWSHLDHHSGCNLGMNFTRTPGGKAKETAGSTGHDTITGAQAPEVWVGGYTPVQES